MRRTQRALYLLGLRSARKNEAEVARAFRQRNKFLSGLGGDLNGLDTRDFECVLHTRNPFVNALGGNGDHHDARSLRLARKVADGFAECQADE